MLLIICSHKKDCGVLIPKITMPFKKTFREPNDIMSSKLGRENALRFASLENFESIGVSKCEYKKVSSWYKLISLINIPVFECPRFWVTSSSRYCHHISNIIVVGQLTFNFHKILN